MSTPTDTTKVARGCGLGTTALNALRHTGCFASAITFSGQLMSFISAAPTTGKSTKSIGPYSPSGCAKNLSNAAQLGLGRRPKSSWGTSELCVLIGSGRLRFIPYLNNIWSSFVFKKHMLPMTRESFSQELLDDDAKGGVSQ